MAQTLPRGRPGTALIEIDPDYLGPKMLALPNDMMRGFCYALTFYTGKNQAEAARLAGYSDKGHTADVQGSRLMTDPRVQEALLELGAALMRSHGAKSIHVLAAIRDDKQANNRDRITAAKELLDRGGFHAVSEAHITHTHQLSDKEKDRRILELCAELGLPEQEARKLLIAPDDAPPIQAEDVIDADFEDVPAMPEKQERREKATRNDEAGKKRARRRMTPEEKAAHDARVKAERSEEAKARYAEAQNRALAEELGIADLI